MSANTVLPRVGDAQNQRLIDIIERSLNALEGWPPSSLVMVTQAVGTADTRVFHGLGRAAAGYFLVRSTVDVRIFDGAVAEATDPANYLRLRASVAATVTLLVF